MAQKICPKCGKAVHPGGIAGHLRFAHGINKPEELKKQIGAAVLDNSLEVLTAEEEREELRERIRELDWEKDNNKLQFSKKEFAVIRRALVMRLEQLDREFEAKYTGTRRIPEEFISESKPGAFKRIVARFNRAFDNKMRAKHGMPVDEKLDDLEGRDEITILYPEVNRKIVVIGENLEAPYDETHYISKEEVARVGGKAEKTTRTKNSEQEPEYEERVVLGLHFRHPKKVNKHG